MSSNEQIAKMMMDEGCPLDLFNQGELRYEVECFLGEAGFEWQQSEMLNGMLDFDARLASNLSAVVPPGCIVVVSKSLNAMIEADLAKRSDENLSTGPKLWAKTIAANMAAHNLEVMRGWRIFRISIGGLDRWLVCGVLTHHEKKSWMAFFTVEEIFFDSLSCRYEVASAA